MYVKDDPRSSLEPATATPKAVTHASYFGSQTGLFYDADPQIDTGGERAWITRGQNFVIVFSQCEAGQVLERRGQPDEYVLLLPDAETAARITAGSRSVDVPGYSIAFVPPGDSRIEVTATGAVVRLFTLEAADLAARASNADAYVAAHPNVPPFRRWPDPPAGFAPRVYSLDVPDDPARFGRIFRCTTFMVNYLNPRIGPRDRRAVSPHHHDDFEQCSLALSGAFTHHLRWPWTTDMTQWREDEHIACGSPSVCVIPPPSIHTTTAEGAGVNQLVDIFSPPRRDFSMKPGWVLNAADYPALPED